MRRVNLDSAKGLGLGLISDYYEQERLVDLAKQAEKSGFSSIWVTEHFCTGDAISLLEAIASQTKKVKLASSVVGVQTRHPVTIAMTFATLDRLNNGRTILGLGLGVSSWLEKLGLTQDAPVSIMSEASMLIRRLLDGGTVDYRGKHFTALNMHLDILPKTRIPIYIAAVGQRMLRFVANRASVNEVDGVISSVGSSTKYVKEATRFLKESSILANGHDTPRVAALIYCSVGKKDNLALIRSVVEILSRPGRAETMLIPGTYSERKMDQLRKEYTRGRVDLASAFLTDEIIDQVSIRGTFRECLERLTDYVESGVHTPVLVPLPPSEKNVIKLAEHFGGRQVDERSI